MTLYLGLGSSHPCSFPRLASCDWSAHSWLVQVAREAEKQREAARAAAEQEDLMARERERLKVCRLLPELYVCQITLVTVRISRAELQLGWESLVWQAASYLGDLTRS